MRRNDVTFSILTERLSPTLPLSLRLDYPSDTVDCAIHTQCIPNRCQLKIAEAHLKPFSGHVLGYYF